MTQTTMSINADQVIETLGVAAEENQVSQLRQHQVVHLPQEGEVYIAGDLHDHRRNFEKFVKAADLGSNPQRHVVLQELIHGDHFDANGAEGSWKILVQAAELKADFPNQVHFLLANHDLAQVHGEGINRRRAPRFWRPLGTRERLNCRLPALVSPRRADA
jgi:hypothetical protein